MAVDRVEIAAAQGAVVGGSESRSGHVRVDLRVDLETTVSRIRALIDKAEGLARHAETLFWETRRSDLEIYGYTTRQGEAAAMKLCEAAHPMLDEILERLAFVADVTYETLGDGDDDTSWDVATATRTFYLPTVTSVCGSLRQMCNQIVDWSRNSDGWNDMSAIREQYGEGLKDVYARARGAVNELGPLWALVVCDKYPALATTNQRLRFTHETPGAITWEVGGGNVLFSYMNVWRSDADISDEHDSISWDMLIPSYEDYECVPVTLMNSALMYIGHGGLVDISVADEAIPEGGSFDNGIYEIVLFTGTSKKLMVVFTRNAADIESTNELEDSVSSVVRFIRKAEPIPSSKIAVQYSIPSGFLDDFFSDVDMLAPKSHLILDNGVNKHYSPKVISSGQTLKFHRYDQTTHNGTVYDAHTRHLFENLTEHTFFACVSV
jgi:hypothetical protein